MNKNMDRPIIAGKKKKSTKKAFDPSAESVNIYDIFIHFLRGFMFYSVCHL